MMWSGVEPQPQKYNATYLDVMKNIIELLESNHIFVLLDMHQDILSSQTGGYDGLPLWLYNRFPSSSHSCKRNYPCNLEYNSFVVYRSLAF